MTLERVFAYYCRCIKNEPERFRFRESMGPKEYAIFCQECEITGEAKGKLSIIDSRRVFKRANMEVRWQQSRQMQPRDTNEPFCAIAAIQPCVFAGG